MPDWTEWNELVDASRRYESPCKGARPASIQKPSHIVIHITGTETFSGVYNRFMTPKQVSAHYLVDREGNIHQFVRDADRAWHAGIIGFVAKLYDKNDGTWRKYKRYDQLYPKGGKYFDAQLNQLTDTSDKNLKANAKLVCRSDDSEWPDYAYFDKRWGRLNQPFYYTQIKDPNNYSIGIELLSFGGTTSDPYPEALYEGLEHLLADLCKKYGIPRDQQHIVGHEDVDPCARWGWDPNQGFDWSRVHKESAASVAFPLDAQAAAHYSLNEGGEGGFYPIGANNFWHGGIHLDADQALHAVADGKLVAYRATKEPLDVALGGTKLPLSNGFVLTRHTRFTPKGAKIEFFVLYTHLLPLDSYGDTQKAAPPPLFSKPKFLVSTTEDSSGGIAGLNVRENGAGTRVLKVAPDGSELDFKDPAAVLKGGKLVTGWYALKAGGSVYVRTGEKPNVKVELTLEGAELDKVVNVDRAVSVGVILGYPGPYLTRPRTVHVEIFTGDVEFMKNPKGDKGGPTSLKVPAGTVFKQRTELEDELVEVNAPAGARLRIVTKGEPYVKVAVDEIVGWAARDAVGDYDANGKKYTLTAALETLYVDVPDDGDSPDTVAIGGSPGDKLKFRQQSGDYRKVGYLLPAAERDKRTGWAKPAELGALDKSDQHYVLAGPLPALHKNNPACLYEFKEDAGKNATEIMVDELPAADPAVAKDASGKTWQEAEFAPGEKGFFQRDHQGIKALSAYDWPHWRKVQEHAGYSKDGLCDAAEIVSIIDTDGDGEMTSKEIAAALKNPRIAGMLRRLACLHPTEWSGELAGIDRLSGAPWNIDKDTLDATKDYIKKLGFWSDVKENGFPAKDKVWHFHPIGFLEHLQTLELLPTAPVLPGETVQGTTEVFLLCEHEFDKNPRCVKDKKGRFEVVASVKKGKDHVTVLHKDTVNASPESLLLEFPGGTAEAKAEGEEGDEYTRYAFDCEHKGPDDYNIISSEFWKRLFGGTTYTIKNLARPVSIVAYPTHKWKLAIKFPSMRGLKVGSKLEKQSMAVAGPGFVSAAQKKTFSLEIEKTGWKKPKSTTTVETSKSSGFVATANQITAVSQFTQSIGQTQKAAGGSIKSVSLKRDDEEISLDKVPSLKSLFSIVKVATSIYDIIREIQENVPKVGWYAELEVQVLQGQFTLEWQWKEHKDYRAFLWMKGGIEMTLFSVALEIGVGVSGLSFKAQVFARVEGAVEVALSAERVSPDAVDVIQIPMKGSITGTVGARFEAGSMLKVEATLETALEIEGTFKVNTSKGCSATLTPRWTGLKGKVTASVGEGGWLGKAEKEHTFIEEKEFDLIEWPKEEPYNPDYVTRAGVKSTVTDGVISWWGGVRVFSGDRQWTDEDVVERITAKIDARRDIRRDGRSVEGLVNDIAKRLDETKTLGWTGYYIEAADFNRMITGGELDRIMTTNYLDPAKEVLNRLGT